MGFSSLLSVLQRP